MPVTEISCWKRCVELTSLNKLSSLGKSPVVNKQAKNKNTYLEVGEWSRESEKNTGHRLNNQE